MTTAATPGVRYYALLEKVEATIKTPKYRITRESSQWDAMQAFTGRDGYVSLYYKPNMSSRKAEAPEMNLEFVTGGVNFTGVKFITTGTSRDNCRYAHGKPCDKPMTNKGANPFYSYAGDGYLLVFHYNGLGVPASIELVVFDCGYLLQPFMGDFAKRAQRGEYNDLLARLRYTARPTTQQTKERHVRQVKNVFAPDERHPGRNKQANRLR